MPVSSRMSGPSGVVIFKGLSVCVYAKMSPPEFPLTRRILSCTRDLILDRIKERARIEWMKRFLLIIACAAGMLAQSKRIAVIAHRGEHLHHPENTLAAFEGAVDAGADYFELDVRTSADGKLVLMHDG